jgi:hypothetical protein
MLSLQAVGFWSHEQTRKDSLRRSARLHVIGELVELPLCFRGRIDHVGFDVVKALATPNAITDYPATCGSCYDIEEENSK